MLTMKKPNLNKLRDPLISCAIHGSKKIRPSPTQHKNPLSCTDLLLLTSTYGKTTNYNDTLFLSLILTGFHAPLYLGELVWTDNHHLQDYRKVCL
jgi:hypothetical protein